MQSWDNLRVFLAVSRGGSLAAAGSELKLDPSTVYRRLRAFEEDLGARLFVRRRGGYTLTEEGRTLLDGANAFQSQMDALERSVSGRDRRLTGEVTITMASAFAFNLLPRYLPGLRARHPGIRVRAVIDQQFSKLSSTDAQVGLRTSRGEEANTVGRRVCRICMSVYASRGYLRTRRAPASYEELRNHDVITMDDSMMHIETMTWLMQHADPERIVYRVNNMYAQRQAVRAGVGVALLGCGDCDEDAELVRLFPPVEELQYDLWLVTHRDLRRTARVRAVLDYLFEAMKGDAALMEGRFPGLD